MSVKAAITGFHSLSDDELYLVMLVLGSADHRRRLQLVSKKWLAISRSHHPRLPLTVFTDNIHQNITIPQRWLAPHQPGGGVTSTTNMVSYSFPRTSRQRAEHATHVSLRTWTRNIGHVDDIHVRSTPSCIPILLHTLCDSLPECHTLRIYQSTPAPSHISLQNVTMQYLLTQQLKRLRTFEYCDGNALDAVHLAMLPSITKLVLKSVRMQNFSLIRMPNLTDLSLDMLLRDSQSFAFINNHLDQLTRLRFSSSVTQPTAVVTSLLRSLTRLVSLELPQVRAEDVPALMGKIDAIPSLTCLHLASVPGGSQYVSTGLRHLRVRSSQGQFQTSGLTHFESRGRLFQSPLELELTLPPSLISAYLPAQHLLATCTCPRLKHLSWFLDPQMVGLDTDMGFMTELLLHLGTLWPHLERMCITPSCDEVPASPIDDAWLNTHGYDAPTALIFYKFANRTAPHTLLHLTYMQHSHVHASAGILTSVRRVHSLRSLVLVHMDVPMHQLRRLSRMPHLERIELINVTGVNQESYASVQREADQARGLCALRVTLRRSQQGFGYQSHGPRLM